MKSEIITTLFRSFEDIRHERDGVEYWYARELQVLLEYREWRNFTNVIDKAKQACESVGQPLEDHFVDVNRMVQLGSGAERKVKDILLTRYACYLVAQNGDPGKTEKDFATELTSHNVVENDLTGDEAISREHIDNNAAVRGMLLKRGVTPEELPPAEDVKKVKRRHESERKKLNKGPKN